MELNPITAFKKAKQKRADKKNALSNGKITLDNLTGVDDAYASKIADLNKAKSKLPFTFRGLEEISSAWMSIGIKGATFNDKVVITSSNKDFFVFDIRRFFDEYNPNASIMINPRGFPGTKIICLDKNKHMISQLSVTADSELFAITKDCRFLTIKGVK